MNSSTVCCHINHIRDTCTCTDIVVLCSVYNLRAIQLDREKEMSESKKRVQIAKNQPKLG